MDVDKLKRMSNAVRTGGKGSVRRKKKAPHRTAPSDDKRLQNTLKRLGVSTIPGIEEVNLFLENNDVLHFVNPKGQAANTGRLSDCSDVVQASITANTYVVTGNAQTKKVSDLWPGIITQMAPDSLASLKRVAEQMQQLQHVGQVPQMPQIAEDDDDVDVPELVENFEDASVET